MWSPLWSPRLRQGDVFGKIDYPTAKAGFARGAENRRSPAHAPEQDAPSVAMLVSRPRYALVISHDCDFNAEKRDYFLVVSIEGLAPRDKKQERLERLRRDNDVRNHTPDSPVALKGFMLDPVPGCLEEPCMAIFESIMPIAMKFRGEMFKLKRAEMDHDTRVLLREKLHFFLGRTQADIADELKAPPPEDPADLEWTELAVGE